MNKEAVCDVYFVCVMPAFKLYVKEARPVSLTSLSVTIIALDGQEHFKLWFV